MNEIEVSAVEMNQVVAKSGAKIHSFEDILLQLSETSSNIVTAAYSMENSVFIVLAKIDHIIYKSRAYESLMRVELKQEAMSVHQCSIGKWYDSEGKRRFAHTPSYAKMKQPHSLIHEFTNKNLLFITNTSADTYLNNSKDIVNNFQEMEKASHELFTIMDQLIVEA
jgi:hypothetical protein